MNETCQFKDCLIGFLKKPQLYDAYETLEKLRDVEQLKGKGFKMKLPANSLPKVSRQYIAKSSQMNFKAI